MKVCSNITTLKNKYAQLIKDARLLKYNTYYWIDILFRRGVYGDNCGIQDTVIKSTIK